MEELNFKIQELTDDIQEIENKCCKLLNYGNVPKENWDTLYELLQLRGSKIGVLNEMIDLKDTILSNQK